MKKIGLILVLFAVSLLFLVNRTNSKLQTYYSGDAVNFDNKVVFASANSGKIEIFKLENNAITKVIVLGNLNPVFNINDDFSDLKLSIEGGQLYIYAVSQYTLYKYNISDLSSAQLTKKSTNNYWEWYQRVDRAGDNIATFSAKGVKIFNSNLEVIDSYNFAISNPYSIRSNGSNKYLFAIDGNKIMIYDRTDRSIVRDIPLSFVYRDNNHRAYFDVLKEEIYAVDDSYTKKFDLNGNLLASFKHLNQPGYEVDSTYDNPYLYFSNGIGVVKMAKDTFKVADYAFTNMSGGPQGWAMGLKVVNTDKGDVLVVFNGSNILLLDKNLKKIDSIKSTSENSSVYATENLFLNVDRDWTLVNSPVVVSGGGFWQQEPLTITFGNAGFSSQTGSNGRFSQSITTPDLKPGHYDIKVTGNNSHTTYSISIEVK